MENNRIFVDGMIFKAPDENTKLKAPWVKGKISIKVEDFINFLNKHKKTDGWLNINLKKSKEKGTLYLELDTYIKAEKNDDLNLDNNVMSKVDYPSEDIDAESIPF